MTSGLLPYQIVEDCLVAYSADELRVIFYLLADRVYLARLIGGHRLCDSTDFKQWLVQLGQAAELQTAVPTPKASSVAVPSGNGALEIRTRPSVPCSANSQTPSEQPRWKEAPKCTDCNHSHIDRSECGVYLGEGQFCHCRGKAVAA